MSKKLLSLSITLLSGSTVTVADTTDNDYGTRAYAEFMARGIVTVTGDDSTTYIPYHAIASVVVTETTEEVTAPTDEFCNVE